MRTIIILLTLLVVGLIACESEQKTYTTEDLMFVEGLWAGDFISLDGRTMEWDTVQAAIRFESKDGKILYREFDQNSINDAAVRYMYFKENNMIQMGEEEFVLENFNLNIEDKKVELSMTRRGLDYERPCTVKKIFTRQNQNLMIEHKVKGDGTDRYLFRNKFVLKKKHF